MGETAKPKKNQPPKIFEDSFFRAERGTLRKAIAFPLAFLFHASIVLAALVIPLMNTSNLPDVEVYSAFLAPPPPPPWRLVD